MMIQIRKYNRLVLLSIMLFILSCSGQKYVTLKGSITKVPNRSSMYKNIDKFDTKLLDIIDTEVIYEQFDPNKNILKRLDTENSRNIYQVVRFYPNGYFNFFGYTFDKEFDKQSFDPLTSGRRGIYYINNNKICFDVFIRTMGMGMVGKVSGKFIVSGDTLTVIWNNKHMSPRTFIKREVPKEYLDYQVDWKSDLEKQGK